MGLVAKESFYKSTIEKVWIKMDVESPINCRRHQLCRCAITKWFTALKCMSQTEVDDKISLFKVYNSWAVEV